MLTLALTFPAYQDFKSQTISDYITLCVGVVALLSNPSMPYGVTSAIVVGSVVLILSVCFEDSLGGGDVKLITAYALSTNFIEAIIIVGFAVLLGWMYGKVRKLRQTPFAPFLLVSHILFDIIINAGRILC